MFSCHTWWLVPFRERNHCWFGHGFMCSKETQPPCFVKGVLFGSGVCLKSVEINRLIEGSRWLNISWPHSHFSFMSLLWMKYPRSQPELWRDRATQSPEEFERRQKMKEAHEWSLGSHPRCSVVCARALPPNTEINQSHGPLDSPPTHSAPSLSCVGGHYKKKQYCTRRYGTYSPLQHLNEVVHYCLSGNGTELFPSLCWHVHVWVYLSRKETDGVSDSMSGVKVIFVTWFSSMVS